MRRDERVAVEMPGQLGFTYLLREYDLISSGDNVIGGYPVALVRKAGDVDLADYKTVFLKRAVFGKQSPVFRDYMVPMTSPPVLLAMSISTWVLSRA